MSELQQGQLMEIREEAALLLTSAKELSGIAVLTEKLRDIGNEIERNLASLKGICILVLTPKAVNNQPDSPLQFDDVQLRVWAVENVLINQSSSGTQKCCSYVAELIAKELHLAQTQMNHTFYCKSITQIPNPNPKNKDLIYEVLFKTSI